jgi:uncharacterized membrane protein
LGLFSFFKKKAFFSEQDQARIVAAISSAEKSTSGEIRLYVESKNPYMDPLQRAAEIFFQSKMENTVDRNGVLLYIALKDRELALFGDEGIHQKVGTQYWQNAVQNMIGQFSKQEIAVGIEQCILQVGQTLKDTFPYDASTDKNELSDEIIFGKPIADMYIDDRAINPYRNDLYSMGYIFNEEPTMPLNSLNPNKYNTVEIVDDKVVKKGPLNFIKGEIFYYENLPKDINFQNYFPKYYGYTTTADMGILKLEHLRGIPAFTLYKTGVLTIEHINIFIEFLQILHSYTNTSIDITTDNIISNYIIDCILYYIIFYITLFILYYI